MSADSKLLGEIVRREREKRQLSQESLAALANISRTYLGEIERGVVNISFITLKALADGLNMNMSQLVEKYEQQEKQRKGIKNA